MISRRSVSLGAALACAAGALCAGAAPAASTTAAEAEADPQPDESAEPAAVGEIVAAAPAPPKEPLWVRTEPEPRIGALSFEGADAGEMRRQLEMLEEGGPLDLRAVREAVRTLHTSRRFSRVAAFVEPMEPRPGSAPGQRWVRLVISLTPVLEIRNVSFPGHSAVAEQSLKSAANLAGAYSQKQLQRAVDDVLALYKRAGYRRASVTVVQRAVPGGVAVEMRVREGPPTRVSAVRFEGEPGLPEEDLRNAFRLGPGDVLSQTQLEEGVRALRERYRKAQRLRARVEAPREEPAPGGRAALVIPVQAGPRVTFHVRGNRAFADRTLLSQLEQDSEEPLDAQAVQEMAGRLRRFYVSQGFLRARLLTRELVGPDGTVRVFFSVVEDKPVRVDSIAFTGNSAVSSPRLLELVTGVLAEGTQVDPAFGADPADVEQTGVSGRAPLRERHRRRYHVDPATVFDPVLYARALRQIEDLYKSEGYLNVQAGPPKVDNPDGPYRARVTIPVREGEQARVASIKLEGGGGELSNEVLQGALTLSTGGVFSYLAAEEGRGRITQLYTSRGHLYAKVEDDETFEESDSRARPPVVRVHVTYRLQPGPLVRVSLLKIESPEELRTVEGLIRELVDIKPGDVLKPETMDRAQQSLLRTGLFFSATLTPMNPAVEEGEKAVQISLRERPTQSFLGSVGFSLNDGPRTTLQYQKGNLWGRNVTFTAVGKADFPFLRYGCTKGALLPDGQSICNGFDLPRDPLERVIDLGLSVPRLYPVTNVIRGGVDLIHQRATQPSYNQTKYSAQVTAETVARRPVSLGLTYEVGYQIFEDRRASLLDAIPPAEQKLFQQPSGTMIFGSLRPTVTLDLRDEPGRTRKGFFAQLGGDYLRSLTKSSFHTNLMRLQALAAGYLPLPFASSLLLSARGGYVYHFDSDSKTPGDRRFYLGGASTLRGFPEDGLQPEDSRASLHQQIDQCHRVASGLACTPGVQLALQGISSGGDLFMALRAEARFAVGGSWELAGFYDVGNLLAQPTALTTPVSDLFKLHDAVGGGLRYATPIGRMSLDVGVNLRPDDDLGERRVGLYFSIDTL